MNKDLRYITTLIEYDYPLVFLSKDITNRFYISTIIGAEEELSYAFVPISPNRLDQLLNQKIDVRTVFLEPDINEYYKCVLNSNSESIFADYIGEEINIDLLPDSGVFVEPIEEFSILSESKTKNRTLLELALEPVSSQSEFIIDVDQLVSTLSAFQKVIDKALKKAVSISKLEMPGLTIDQSRLQVYGFSKGSFKVHMQTKAFPDLLGVSNIEIALKILDDIIRNYNNHEKLKEITYEYRGHFISSLRTLLAEVVGEAVPFKYKWISPSMDKPVELVLTLDKATNLIEFLEEEEGLDIEIQEFVGIVKKIDVDNGVWKLLDDAGEYHSGKIDSNSSISLSGITADTITYKFICREELTTIKSTGEDKVELYLIRFETVR